MDYTDIIYYADIKTFMPYFVGNGVIANPDTGWHHLPGCDCEFCK